MNSLYKVKRIFDNDLILIILGLLLFSLSFYINKKNTRPKIEIKKQDTAITLNRDLLRIFNLGNKRLLADIIWIQTLIEGDEEHYSKNDLNSWMYHRFMSIAALDPLFYENYIHGGMYLSIVKDDLLGAKDLLEQGLKYFPYDFKLNYNMGYTLVFELGEKKKGLVYFEKILNDKNLPSFFPSIINKLRYEVFENYDSAMYFLKDRLKQTKDQSIQNKIKYEIYSLKAEKDLKCLNTHQTNCDKTDSDGKPYQKNQKNEWQSLKPIRKYRLN
jgi:hypothetical protein